MIKIFIATQSGEKTTPKYSKTQNEGVDTSSANILFKREFSSSRSLRRLVSSPYFWTILD